MDGATHATSARSAAWGPQDQIRGGATSDNRPALVRFGDRLFAIYRGVDDPGIFYTTTTDGVSWTPQAYLGAATSDTPAAVAYGGRIYVFWKSHSDQTLWYKSSSDGASWASELNHHLTVAAGSSGGPSVTMFGNLLHVVWKGIEGDQRNVLGVQQRRRELHRATAGRRQHQRWPSPGCRLRQPGPVVPGVEGRAGGQPDLPDTDGHRLDLG